MRVKLLMNRRIGFSIAIVLLLGLAVSVGEAMSKLRTQFGDEPGRQAYNEEVKQLLTMVRDKWLRQSEPDRVAQAIKRLGELKSKGAITDLTHLLTFKRTFEWESQTGEAVDEIHLITAAERYPATGALIEIGKPSLPALIEVIEAHGSSSLESENARYAVMIIFRDNPARAVDYMRKAVAKASSPEAEQRLSYAADKVAEIVKKLTQQ
jgi:hypothetical protein